MLRIEHFSLGALWALAAAGCASFGNSGGGHAIRVAPSETHAEAFMGARTPADVAYQEALKHHAALRYDAAIVSYRLALQSYPAHVGARNGLGILLSSLGRHDEAVRELEAAVALAPYEAYLRNNLGYAHLLGGTLPKALAEFEAAKQLDPSSRRIEENLRIAHSRLGGSGEPRKEAPLAAPAPATMPPPNEKPAPSALRSSMLVLVAPQVYELRERHAEPARPSVLAASPSVVPAISSATVDRTAAAPSNETRKRPRLEVANGNGLNGYARRVSAALHRAGWETARLTNQLPYTQRVTEVHYREGYVTDAMKLAASLKDGVLIVRNDALPPQVNLRLVLGHDAWTPAALVRHEPSESQPLRMTEATPAKQR
jgi:tetratricopeptide (TPR) repeat protein